MEKELYIIKYVYNPGQNIWSGMEKSSRTGQENLFM